MLNNITWQGYWTTLALLSAGYYLAIYLLYYRNDFRIEFPQRNGLKKYPETSPAITSFMQEQNQPLIVDEQEDLEFETPAAKNERLVYACMDELNAYFEQVKGTKCAKQEFMLAVQKILSKYSALKDSEFKDSILKLIVSEATHHCSIHLNEEDVVHVWLEK